MNPYQYAYNNPLRYVDPSGKIVLYDVGVIAGKLFSQYLNANCLSMADFGRALLAGTAAIVVGIAVGVVVGALGVALLPGSLLAAVIFGAAGGVLAGQNSRLVSNLILGRDPTEGMFNPRDMLIDGILGGIGGVFGYGLAKAVKAAGNSVDDVINTGKSSLLYDDPHSLTRQLVKDLQNALPDGSKGRVTMAVGVVEDVNGIRSIVIGTSERNGILRAGIKGFLQENNLSVIIAKGTSHAERNILAFAQDTGQKVISIGAGRPICEICAIAIQNAGTNPSTSIKIIRGK